MYEDLALAEALYFLLLSSSYILLSGRREGAGTALALLSLAPPTVMTFKYLSTFELVAARFFLENRWAYLALAVATFLVLLAVFYSISCEELPEKVLCVYMSFAAAIVGCLFLLMTAAAGGLALAFASLHYVTTALIYETARKTERKLSAGVYVLPKLRGLEEACRRNDPWQALAELRAVEPYLREPARSEAREILAVLEYQLERGEDATGLLRVLEGFAKAWRAQIE